MNPMLLLPAGLAALAALALPLLIHLAKRQQQRPTVFAALRWLRARPRPRRRVRIDEPWLLAVRLLLVALLAVLLAQPALLGVEDKRPRLLVAPGVDDAMLLAARADPEVDARWLAPGFPALDGAAPLGDFASASLLREFDATLPTAAPLAVLVPERMTGADAARLQFTRQVEWRIAAGGAWPEPMADKAPTIAIRHDVAHRDGVRYLRAAALAWADAEDATIDAAESTNLPAENTEVLAWMHAGPLPDDVLHWAQAGGQVLLPADAEIPGGSAPVAVWRDDDGDPLVHATQAGKGRLLQLAHALAPGAMPQLLEPTFPHALRELLQPAPAPTAVAAADYVPGTGGLAMAPVPLDLRPWLALAIALLALLERWLATSRRRGAAA